jgi:hypothetical protein
MIDERERYERAFRQFQMTEPAWEILVDRRDRKRRNQRIVAGVVGIAVFVAAVWIVTSVSSLDRSETSVVPAGDVTGSAAETGPAENADRGESPDPPRLVEPAQIGTVTRSGAGCALEIAAKPIPSGAGRLSVVNETNLRVSFELYRLRSRSSFAGFEAFAAENKFFGVTVGRFAQDPPGASLLVQREVGPTASGTITDNFTTGDAFAVVCLDPQAGIDFFPDYKPFAVVGPIVVR